jgi:DNA repair exonuclease SbcCD ATPase subunit
MKAATENELKSYLEKRFNQLDDRFSKLDKDLAVYAAKTDERLNSIDTQLADLKAMTVQAGAIEPRLHSIDTQLADLKSRVGQQAAWFVSLLFLFLSALIALAAKLAKLY